MEHQTEVIINRQSESKKPVRRIPVSAHQRALQNSPTVISQFPLIFLNKNYFSEWTGDCIECGKEIDSSQMRGTVTWPIDSVAVIEAVGACPSCNLLTPFRCRVRDDLSMEWVNSEGKWCRTDDHGTHSLGAETTAEPFNLGRLAKSVVVGWGVFLMLMLPMVLGLIKAGRIGM